MFPGSKGDGVEGYFTVFTPAIPGVALSAAAVVEAVIGVKDVGKYLHMAYPVNGALTLALTSSAAVDTLIAHGAKGKTLQFVFYRGERRGALVRMYGLPWSATYASVSAALEEQLGAVNHLVLRSYKGTSVLTGEALAWVSLREEGEHRSRGHLVFGGRTVKIKIDHPQSAEPSAPTKPSSDESPAMEPVPVATPSAAPTSSATPSASAPVTVPTLAAPVPAPATANKDVTSATPAYNPPAPKEDSSNASPPRKQQSGLKKGFLVADEPASSRLPTASPALAALSLPPTKKVRASTSPPSDRDYESDEINMDT